MKINKEQIARVTSTEKWATDTNKLFTKEKSKIIHMKICSK